MKLNELYNSNFNDFVKLIKVLFPKDNDNEGLQVVLYDKINPNIPYFLINNQLWSLSSLGNLIDDMIVKSKILKKFKLI